MQLTVVRLPAFFLYLFCVEFYPVLYLTTVTARAGLFITPEMAHIHKVLAGIIDLAKVSNLVLSLLTNAVATSIIAIRSWCVRVIFKFDLMLTCTLMTRTLVIKEISQDFDKLECRWPSYTGMQSIGFPGRV